MKSFKINTYINNEVSTISFIEIKYFNINTNREINIIFEENNTDNVLIDDTLYVHNFDNYNLKINIDNELVEIPIYKVLYVKFVQNYEVSDDNLSYNDLKLKLFKINTNIKTYVNNVKYIKYRITDSSLENISEVYNIFNIDNLERRTDKLFLLYNIKENPFKYCRNIKLSNFNNVLIKFIDDKVEMYLEYASNYLPLLSLTKDENLEMLNNIIENRTVVSHNGVFGNYDAIKLFIESEKLKLNDINSIYLSFRKRFPNGKIRTLHGPLEPVMEPLVNLNKNLQRKYGDINPTIQTAYKVGMSIVDNVTPHKDNRYIYKADISNFFPSCKRELVKGYTSYLFDNNIYEFLNNKFLDIILVDDGLCLGNPVSATLANRIIAAPTLLINNICKKYNCTVTQYSDDLTVSANWKMNKQFIVNIFNTAYSKYNLSEYFKIKPSKLRGQTGNARNVTGLAFDHCDNNNPTVRRWIRSFMN